MDKRVQHCRPDYHHEDLSGRANNYTPKLDQLNQI